MKYKGYIGHVEYDEDAKFFQGEIVNTTVVITFQGTSVNEIEQAFVDSIDDYLDWCNERGKEPEKPYSGKFNLRISPELHKEVVLASKNQNLTINKFLEKAIIDELRV